MPLPGCKISLGVDGDTAYIRLVGRAAAESTPAFEAAVQRLRSAGVGRFVLDLSEILLMDSGFSGMISGFVRDSGVSFALHRPPQRILDTLADHGVLELVTLLPTADAAGVTETGPAEDLAPGTRAEVLRCCLESHRTLMALKPENVAKFQMVEQYLARELAKESGTPG
jgi:anti-anti-sigma regulatory factor